MKTIFKILPALLFIFSASAENYRILNLNTGTIGIGEKVCRVGDSFDSNEVIHWDPKVPLQAMKVDIAGRGQRYLHQKEFKKYNCKTLADFLLHSKAMSRREMPLSSERDHIEYLEGQVFMVADTIKIASSWRVDDNNYFELSYDRQGEWVKARLTTDDQMNLLITADLFDHPTLQPDGIIRCMVRYVEEAYNESTLLTDNMQVILVPEHYKHIRRVRSCKSFHSIQQDKCSPILRI